MINKHLTAYLLIFGLFFSGIAKKSFADASQLAKAEMYVKAGQYAQAEEIYKQIIAAAPGTNDAFAAQKKLTDFYISQRKFSKADAALEQMLAGYANNDGIAQAVYEAASAYRGAGEYHRANTLSQYVVEQWPGSEQAFSAQVDLINTHLSQNNAPATQAAIDKLLTSFSDRAQFAKTVREIGTYCSWLNKHEKAVELYRYVAERWPVSEEGLGAQGDLAKLYLSQGKETEAGAAVDKMLAAADEDVVKAKAIRRTAKDYYELKKYQKAGRS